MSENLVIIPTYKEKENIEKIIRYVFNLPMAFDILIIDDNSPDGTAEYGIVKGIDKDGNVIAEQGTRVDEKLFKKIQKLEADKVLITPFVSDEVDYLSADAEGLFFL